MTVTSRSIPGLFGGVSQQIPALRHPTQCSAQDNGLATLVDGLYKRPGSKHLATLAQSAAGGYSVASSYGSALVHVIDQGDAGAYALVLVNGSFMVYDLLTGAAQTLQAPNGFTYLSTSSPEKDFRCVTVADYTFIVNQSKVPAMTTAVAAANPTTVAYINVRTATVKTTYSVTLNGVTTSVTTGDTATNKDIANQLRTALTATMSGWSFYVLADTNIIKATSPGAAVTCSVSDGWSNRCLQCLNNGVETYSDLPAVFEAGYVVTINGDPSQKQDPYFVQWDGKKWAETTKPGVTTTFDPATMPHQLVRNTDGTWTFGRVTTWAPRKVGDDTTNPVPSFIGQAIRGAFFFRNRLGFLAGDSVILSRAGSYFNFWASSATQVLDTDPIDLGATSENVLTLDWAVPFNNTLLVWATSKQQFALVSGDVLTPSSAQLKPTTTFDADPAVRPESLGNRILFASKVGSYATCSVYRVSDDTVTNTAEEVTSHVPSFVPASPRHIAVSTPLKLAALVPSGVSNELRLFKYDGDQEFSQKAWSRVVFPAGDTVRVMRAHWRGRTLFLVLHVTNVSDPVAGGRFVLQSIDFEYAAADLNAPFGLRLDGRCLATVGTFDGTNTTVDVPYLTADSLTYLKCVSGAEPVELTVVSSQAIPGSLLTRAVLAGDLRGATVWAGKKYLFRYVFTEPVPRDSNDLPIMGATVKLARVIVRYVKTGWFKAKVTPLLRGTYEYPMSGRTIGMPGQGPSQLAVSTGSFTIPVQARAEGTEVALESDSYLPCTFPYAEWVGDVTLKARR